MRSAAVAALSARFPELPRLWAVVLRVGYARFRTLASSVAASLSQCIPEAFPETDEGIPPFTPFVQELSSVRYELHSAAKL